MSAVVFAGALPAASSHAESVERPSAESGSLFGEALVAAGETFSQTPQSAGLVDEPEGAAPSASDATAGGAETTQESGIVAATLALLLALPAVDGRADARGGIAAQDAVDDGVPADVSGPDMRGAADQPGVTSPTVSVEPAPGPSSVDGGAAAIALVADPLSAAGGADESDLAVSVAPDAVSAQPSGAGYTSVASATGARATAVAASAAGSGAEARAGAHAGARADAHADVHASGDVEVPSRPSATPNQSAAVAGERAPDAGPAPVVLARPAAAAAAAAAPRASEGPATIPGAGPDRAAPVDGAPAVARTSAGERTATAPASVSPTIAPAPPVPAATSIAVVAASEPTASAGPITRAVAAQVSPVVVSIAQRPTGTHQLTMTVNPDSLGPVTVRAHIGQSGDVRVELIGATDAGRDALRAIVTDLRRDLAAAMPHASLSIAQGSAADAGADRGSQPFGAGANGDSAGGRDAAPDASAQAAHGDPRAAAARSAAASASGTASIDHDPAAYGLDILA
ncbi:hypothetical protein [Microbacterium sp. 1.5R]|uniref:hypothetical protein n=1 Tax=Microbacterium sp. 1.5R TaxID=1916917 RepID=UPI0016425C97|nr:hypothetical protein [Microbacterium sp. 1.5R]